MNEKGRECESQICGKRGKANLKSHDPRVVNRLCCSVELNAQVKNE